MPSENSEKIFSLFMSRVYNLKNSITMTEMVPPSAPVPPNKKNVTGLEFLEGISVRRVSVLSF